jgi:hypothetical protein
MLYAKKIAVAKTPAAPARVVGKSVVPTKVEALLNKWATKIPTPAVTTAADGSITIPAVAFTSKNKSASLTVMKSAGTVHTPYTILHTPYTVPTIHHTPYTILHTPYTVLIPCDE